METLLRTVLRRQFGAAIDMLENALLSCPTELWGERLWPDPPDEPRPSWLPSAFAEFWFVVYHAIFWLDLYLAGVPEEEFAPPAPFVWVELDPAVQLQRQYTKEELHAYLAATRRKCHALLEAITVEEARRTVEYPWTRGEGISYLELQLYNMRHVQEHAAQLNLFLGQQGIQLRDWSAQAQDDTDGTLP